MVVSVGSPHPGGMVVYALRVRRGRVARGGEWRCVFGKTGSCVRCSRVPEVGRVGEGPIQMTEGAVAARSEMVAQRTKGPLPTVIHARDLHDAEAGGDTRGHGEDFRAS